MSLKAEQIQENWERFLKIIDIYISEPRKEKLLEFYKRHENRIALMPASHKKEYHNAFPGGYVDHVIRVVESAIHLSKLWEKMGCDMSTFTNEELIFSALNHDLGKMGSEEEPAYITQDDQWRRDKLGEDYKHSTNLPFASVPDRGLFLLQSNGIQYSFNEMLAIQTHDGLYDDGNKKYLMSYGPETKLRTSLPFILHQADMIAARIEFENEWLPKLKLKPKPDNNKPVNKKNKQDKALSSIKSESLSNSLKDV